MKLFQCGAASFLSYKQNRTALAKLTGIPPLHGSHAAVPFACDGFFTLGLWLYGSIIITIGKSWRQLCQKLHTVRWHESLACYPSFRGHGVSARRLFPYRNVFDCFILFSRNNGLSACQNIPAVVCFDRVANIPVREAWSISSRFHERENVLFFSDFKG